MKTSDERLRVIDLRRRAAMVGLRLEKSRRRDPNALDFDRYSLLNPRTREPINAPIVGQFVHSLTFEEVEKIIDERRKAERSKKKS